MFSRYEVYTTVQSIYCYPESDVLKNRLSIRDKDALKQKDNEIEKIKKNNQDLYNCIQGLPKIIRKLFIKNKNVELLNN